VPKGNSRYRARSPGFAGFILRKGAPMGDDGHAAMTARDLRQRLPAARRERSYHVSLLLFALSAGAYLLTFVFACWPNWPALNLVSALANGGVIGLLFIIGHDACHGSFTPSPALNRLLARLAFLPSLQPYTSWVFTHNGLHHGWTNLKGKDVVFAPFSVAEFNALPRCRRWLERVYRTPLGVGLMHLVQVWWKYELFPPRTHAPKGKGMFHFDRLLVLGFFLAKGGVTLLLSFLVCHDPVLAVARAGVVLLLIYAVWFWLIGLVTFVQHTNPEVPWYDDAGEWTFYRGQVHATPHVHLPLWLHRLLHNVMDHTAHHVDPLIPMYRLPPAQRSLERTCRTDVVASPWSLRGYIRSLKVCRLYDYTGHQWLDFDGTPTSRPGLNLLAADLRPRQAA
jgi:acyl-lipid omega-6 desaturase (Delta-12 desaturase)